MRIDKWLWAARFYKTRQLAVKAIKTGKITLNGQSLSKPAATIKPGNLIELQRGPYRIEIEVLALSDKRGPASIAQTLYSETTKSIEARAVLKEELAAQPRIFVDKRKPDRRDVRRHREFKRRSET